MTDWLLPDHREMLAKLPEEEKPWWLMRLGKLLSRTPPSTGQKLLAVHIATTTSKARRAA
jgi:hypothetical protein